MPKTSKQPPQTEPDGTTTGMLHRRPGQDCPLCPLWGIPWDDNDPATWNKQHVHAEALWDDWAPSDKSGRWIANVIDTAKDLGIEVTPEQVKAHFSDRHKIEQPMMTGSLNHDHLLALANGFSEEGQAVINAIYRQHVLMTRQIVDVFYGRGRSLNAARQAALGELSPLAQAHFLYRYYPSDEDAKRKNPPPQFSKSAIWYLGRAAIPYIKERYGLNFYPPHITRAREVKTETMIHDLKANGIFSSICARLNEAKGKIPYQDTDILLEALPANWYGPGPQALNMAFLDRQTTQERRIMPDGFASLSVHRSGDISNCQLPFFYEFDNGTRDPKDVAGQLLAYHLLALSGVATRRFPDLDIDQYAIPMLMVFSDKGRAKKITRLFRERTQTELGIENGAPIFVAVEKDWNSDPFAGGLVRQAWEEDDTGYSFLDLLVNASRPLIESKNVSADQVLQLDTTVGVANTTGGTASVAAVDQIEKPRPDTPANVPASTVGNQVSAGSATSDQEVSAKEAVSSVAPVISSPQTIVTEENRSQTMPTAEQTMPERIESPLFPSDKASQSEESSRQALPAVSDPASTVRSPEQLALEIVATKQYLQQLEEQQRELIGHEEVIEPELPFALPAGADFEEEAGPALEAPEREAAPELMPPSDPADPFSTGAAGPPQAEGHLQAPPAPVQGQQLVSPDRPVSMDENAAQEIPPAAPAISTPAPLPSTEEEYTPAWEALEDQPRPQESPSAPAAEAEVSQPIMPSQPAPIPTEHTETTTEQAPPVVTAPPQAPFPSLEDELGWEEATPDSPQPPLPIPDATGAVLQNEDQTGLIQPVPDEAPLIPDYQHTPPVSNDPLQQQSLQNLPELPDAPEPVLPRLDLDEEAMLPSDSPLRTTAPPTSGEMPHVAGPAAQELPPPPVASIPSEPIPPAYSSEPALDRPVPPKTPAPHLDPDDDPLADLPPLPGPGNQSIFADEAEAEQSQSVVQHEIVNPLPVTAEPIQEADTVPVGSVEDRLNNTAAARRAKRRRNKS